MSEIERLLEQAQVAWKAQDLNTTLRTLTEALEGSPEDARVWRALGRLFNEMGEPERALDASEHAVELEPEVSRGHYQRGLALQELGRLDDALAAYEQATLLDPQDSWAWVNRGRLQDDMGNHAEALASYERALALDPADEIAWTNQGNSHLALEHFEQALESYERALALDPTSGPARLGQASSLLELGRIDEANAANPAGTPWDRGTAHELSHALADGRRLVLRYQTEGHSHPEWLATEAKDLLATCASCADTPPGLGEGVTIAYVLSWLSVRADDEGQTLVLCEPDFAGDPLVDRHGTVSFTLKAHVMMNLLHTMVDADPVEASFADVMEVGPEVLSGSVVVARRLAGAREGHSGWWLGPEDEAAWRALKEAGDFVQMRAAELLPVKPWLAKPLTLPVGWVARFEDHRLTSVKDETGKERWATGDGDAGTRGGTSTPLGKSGNSGGGLGKSGNSGGGAGKSGKGGKGPWA